jgi:Mce-associated membrane protein
VSETARPRPSAHRRAPASGADELDAAGSQQTAVADPPEDTVPDDASEQADDDAAPRQRRRISVPLVPALGVLLLLLLGLNAYLLAPRLFADESSVRTGTYVAVLQAARSNVVDLTSFDYLTIDDDIEQARRVTTGDLTEESVTGLENVRQQLVDGQAVTSTEVVGAGVTRATEDEGTVVMVIATTRQAAGVAAQVRRDRIEVDLRREGDRWLLSAIRGTGPDD